MVFFIHVRRCKSKCTGTYESIVILLPYINFNCLKMFSAMSEGAAKFSRKLGRGYENPFKYFLMSSTFSPARTNDSSLEQRKIRYEDFGALILGTEKFRAKFTELSFYFTRKQRRILTRYKATFDRQHRFQTFKKVCVKLKNLFP